jgi:hypothetical protein
MCTVDDDINFVANVLHPVANSLHPLINALSSLIDTLNPLIDTLHLVLDVHHPLIDAMRGPHILCSCRPMFLLYQRVEPPQCILDIRLSYKLLKEPL